MNRSNALPGCPPGLEYLTQIDKIFVQQKIDYIEGIYCRMKIVYNDKIKQIYVFFSFYW
jgi:hypothetical protein